MLNRIIIFEGPDGVGKTTLINHIRKEYDNSYYMHLRVHKEYEIMAYSFCTSCYKNEK
jgi:thymidylate kinase